MPTIRNLVFILGDQLDHESAAFDGYDRSQDLIFMAEVDGESTYAWSHKVRIAYFLSAMRHFAEELSGNSFKVEYRSLEADGNEGDLERELRRCIAVWKPRKLVVVEPGEYRIEEMLKTAATELNVELEIRPDRHFFCSRQEFAKWAQGRKQLRMEFFYREMRKKTGYLMDHGAPAGAQWNFDTDNRGSFSKRGPGEVAAPISFPPDEITRDVFRVVQARFADHPGSLEHFDFPVTSKDAQLALHDFIAHRLPSFGAYQDAMWTDEPILYHSRLSATMNTKLLNPRAVVMAAEDAFHRGHAPLAAVEGFVRQIIGWREYVRGIYWTYMPSYLEGNALNATAPLPDYYWTAQTEMNCLRHTIGQTLEYGYAHHIQRLMVTGLFALLYGVDPVQVHKWYLAVYVDAVEWVELPNTIGMSQFSDGGLMASKPYVATGKYISRMSNYCKGCRYKPDKSTGEDACPFTTLYWEFLMKHEKLLAHNARMDLQLRNLVRLTPAKRQEIRDRATWVRSGMPSVTATLIPLP